MASEYHLSPKGKPEKPSQPTARQKLLYTEITSRLEASGEVRSLLRTALASANQSEMYDDAALVITEMVTNAVTHASGPIIVEVHQLETWILLLVRDTTVSTVEARTIDHGATSGRGLHIVSTLSAVTGVANENFGKTVWAVLGRDSWPPFESCGLWRQELEQSLPYWDVHVDLVNFPATLFEEWRPRIQASMSLLARAFTTRDAAVSEMGSRSMAALQVLDDGLAIDDKWHRSAADQGRFHEVPNRQDRRLVLSRTQILLFDELRYGANRAVELSHRSEIDIPKPREELGEFREWLCGEVRRQSRGSAARPWPSLGHERGDWREAEEKNRP